MKNNIKKHMKARGIKSFQELGEMCNIGKESVKKYAANVNMPSLFNAVLISCALHRELGEVFQFDETERKILRTAYEKGINYGKQDR